jgi:hypothetical protein
MQQTKPSKRVGIVARQKLLDRDKIFQRFRHFPALHF